MCFEEVPNIRKKQVEGRESKLRDKKGSKKMSVELREARTELQSHDLSALSSDYELPRSDE